MKTAILTKIALVLAALYLACPGMSRAEAPEYDITIGRTIDVPGPSGLVYRDDGFWVISWNIREGTRLRHYSADRDTWGEELGNYAVPEVYLVQGLAWDGKYWWIADNIHPSGDKIEKCELTSTGLNVLQRYTWPGPGSGPVAIEWAQGYLWVVDNHADVIYRTTVNDTSFTSVEASSSGNIAPYGLAWDGTNMWSSCSPAGGGTSGPREIYKHDANGNIIEIWHYPGADGPPPGAYGGCATDIAFAGNRLWYCDYDKNQIIEAIFSQPAGGWIAFGSNRDGDNDIWAIRPDGTGLRQLVNMPGEQSSPQWSPDSSRIVYVTGPVQIWVYDWFAGTNAKIYDAHDYQGRNLGSYSAYWPAWSPDGSKILYAEEFSYNDPHIMVINADGTGRTIVPVQSGFVTIPSWCPSGTAFVYNRRSGASYSEDLWIYDFTATGDIMNGVNHRLTQGASSESTIKYYADWTPNGDIVFVWGHNLAVIDPGQSPNWNGPVSNPLDPHVTFLTNDASLPSPRYLWPSWSPDLSQIVYGYYSGTWDLWIMDASAGNRRQLTATLYDEASPDWGNPTAQPATTLHVDATSGNDNNNGLTRKTPFATIKKGIDSAKDGFKVLVYLGVYQEEISFKGKAITVQGVATQSGIPIIENPGDFAVSFYNGEGPRSIVKNFVVRNSFMGIFIAGSSPTITNLNILDNKYGIDAYAGSEPDISNCIFWENSDSDLFGCEARYSFVQQDIEPLPLRGLVACWSFDENSRNIVPDKSGNGHNGTIYGATWTQGIAGTGLCFDGLNDYVDVPDDGGLSLTDAVTVSAWIWLDPDWLPEGHGGAGAIVCKHNDVEGRGYALRVLKDRRLRALLEGLNFDSQSKLNLGQWTHIAFTLDPSNGMVSLYINGNKEGRGAIAGGFTSSGCELRIGDQSCYPGGTGTEVFYGVIDEALIYDRALTPREIQQLSRGGLTSNPLFADANNGDYHLLSERGRYWPRPDVWVLDKVTSPCIDGGDPNDDVLDEPMPNGGLINMGAYGGTPYASMSETKWLDGDVNHDGIVNLIDLAMLAENWLRTGIGLELPANYNWLSYNAHHYALTLQYGIWEQAEAEAVAVGGHLVTINNQLENYWAVETINNIYTQGGLHNIAWIGLEYVSGDRSNPNSWRWVNGEPVTYWRPYSYGLDPAGNHMYLEGNSQIDPGGWGNGTAHETDPTKFPRGIIELPW